MSWQICKTEECALSPCRVLCSGTMRVCVLDGVLIGWWHPATPEDLAEIFKSAKTALCDATYWG